MALRLANVAADVVLFRMIIWPSNLCIWIVESSLRLTPTPQTHPASGRVTAKLAAMVSVDGIRPLCL